MSMTKDNKNEMQEILAQTMDTDEGRVALAQAMVEPIRRSLEYQAVGRKFLMVDNLPQGVLPRYERDVQSIAHIVSRSGAAPDQIQTGEEILVPTFEIVVNPTVRMSEIRQRRFYIVDRAQIKAKEAIQKEEDTNIFNAMQAAVLDSQTATCVGNLSADALNDAFAYIESHDLVCAKMVMHALQYKSIRLLGKDFYDEATQRHIISTGLFGHLWTADIHVSSRMDTDQVLLAAMPETVGVLAVRQDITVLPADDPKKLRLGWVIYEEIGLCIINDYAIAKVEMTTST